MPFCDQADIRWMRLALSLGNREQGQTWPNPAVGCVIVKDGRIVGRGWTQRTGRPHAETMALSQAGQAAKGATVYVTLEPCAHQGKTPPCAQALSKAGVGRVVVALTDPDVRVAGKGIAFLRAAGMPVTNGVLSGLAQQAHAGFFKRINQGLPFVTLKLAASLDGKIATQSHESRWITGPSSRRCVHLMRHRHDAVMIGSGTALADDPALTVRINGLETQPVRIVLDRISRLPVTSRLAQNLSKSPVWLCHSKNAPAERIEDWKRLGAKAIECHEISGKLDLGDVLKKLAAKGLTRIFCEGGGQIAASLLRRKLVDELMCFHAGVALGAEGIPALGELGIQHLPDAPRFSLCKTVQAGSDVLSIWQLD